MVEAGAFRRTGSTWNAEAIRTRSGAERAAKRARPGMGGQEVRAGAWTNVNLAAPLPRIATAELQSLAEQNDPSHFNGATFTAA